MPTVIKKQVQVFMTTDDEERFGEILVQAMPRIAFIDGSRWHSASPPLTSSIAAGKSKQVYLWDPTILPELPTYRRDDGTFEGPTTGFVIQFDRSRVGDEFILAGSIAVGLRSDQPKYKEMANFAKNTWAALKKCSSSSLVGIDPISKLPLAILPDGYLVGDGAVNWCRSNPGRLLRDRASNLFVPR